ncbi:2,3-dihydroxy-2,3-dihydrophenylpropionate dehydrogenase [Mycobacterium europaeum]|uniref:2,3-dihydroxy-2,3-dihydrophenylpropionate dehydrogenase n=1 Tax=Mycobacterium europaeum TaxID=761804 RepID=A0A0U1DLH8_9MYCO|nr:3-(cis-5,6-dihydroxycyclohexa-1,3-dien-1-yl)propanoate dehydrogenase [Mycobacterium europaeum]CQD18721.1 2,3-dihydroxy-2,3-dihydrophenylpropionate dehydrogenase [Mycobacterium europaeum]
MTGWLEDRRALVVGAGSGIGRAIVDAFLAEGARVAVLERDPDKCAALSTAHPEVVTTVGDATTRIPNDLAVAAAVKAFGGLDVLVNCVGVFDFYRSIEDLDADLIDDAFDEIFRVNVKSHLHSVKAALPALHQSEHAVILLTESTSAYYPGRGGVLYVASKFAVRGLVTALAHDLAPGVRVNGIAPGGTLGTELRGVASLGSAERSMSDTPERAAELATRVPLQVALSGEDHAWSYVFLASDRSRGITGGVVHSDGGMSVAGAPKKRR